MLLLQHTEAQDFSLTKAFTNTELTLKKARTEL